MGWGRGSAYREKSSNMEDKKNQRPVNGDGEVGYYWANGLRFLEDRCGEQKTKMNLTACQREE